MKKKTANSTLIILEDQRGRHKNRTNQYPQELVDEVVQHIQQFPVMESHYCREDTKRQYLEEGLSTAKMYRMYVAQKRAKMDGMINMEDNCSNEIEGISEGDDDDDNSEDDNDGNVEEKEIEEEEDDKESQGTEKKKKKKKSYDVTDPNFVRLRKYASIFNETFNYGFFKPKKDR